MFRTLILAATFGLAGALPAAAEGPITIEDAYARAAGPGAMAGAAFMTIVNAGAEDDRLIAATSDAAQRVELHTHVIDVNGVARMFEVEDGFVIPAGGSHRLERGSDHVMFMGLTGPFVDGESVTVTLTFEQAGDLTVEIPVDLSRQPGGHGGHGMGG